MRSHSSRSSAMLKYLKLLDSVCGDATPQSFVAGRLYLVLSVLRSDVRALSNYLRTRSGELLADSFEHDLLRTRADDLSARYEALLSAAHRLIEIRGSFECVNANLRIELRRAFEHELPSPDSGTAEIELRRLVSSSVGQLRPAVQNAVLFLGKTLGQKLEEGQVFDDHAAKRQLSERLRQNVWMFAQIVRAFSAKAKHARGSEDAWGGVSGLVFVREFLAYFRAMGFPLLRASDYPRFQSFVAAMNGLEDTDLLDPSKLDAAVAECDAFHEFLIKLVEDVGKREELAGIPFDKRAAASALRLYLGE